MIIIEKGQDLVTRHFKKDIKRTYADNVSETYAYAVKYVNNSRMCG
jgi:hypothetical protein